MSNIINYSGTATGQRQAARVTLDTDTDTVNIEFAEDFDTPPAVAVAIQIPDNGDRIIVNPQNVTVHGFTVTLAGPVPASGYVLNYIAEEAVSI